MSNIVKTDNKQPQLISKYSWFIWGAVSFFYLFQYILRISPSIMMNDVTHKFSVTAEDYGYFSAAYYLGYTLMHIPFGIMLDRCRINIIVSAAICASVIGLIPLIYSDSWAIAIIGRFMVGAGSSGAILAIFKATSNFFPEKLFAKMLGISVTIGLLGAIYGGTPIDKLSSQIGWQYVLTILIAIGLITAFLVYIFRPGKNAQATCLIKKESIMSELKVVITNKRVVALAVFSGFMVGPLEGFADVWAVPFLQNVYSYSRDAATSLPTLIFIGMCIGSSILPIIAEKRRDYYQVIIVCGLIMTAVFIAILSLRFDYIVSAILFFIVGICCAYQILAIYLNSKNTNKAHQGLTTAVTNMIIMSFGSLFHFSIGKIVHAGWNEQMVDNIPVYLPQSYIYSLSVIPASLVIGVIGIYFLKLRK